MKKQLLIILGLALAVFSTAAAQELMTIGEVFDFAIGDEFQTRSSVNYQPPNADRITITGKYYAETQDTVYYIRHHDSYFAEMSWEGEPHLIYHYGTSSDIVFYTDLDSSISKYDPGFDISQYIETSAEFCDSLINGCSFSSGPGFENDYIVNEYGKGLGMTYQYFYSGLGGTVTIDKSLFYYKKGILTCGEPDMTGVGAGYIAAEAADFTVYPNPATDQIVLLFNGRNLTGQIWVSILNAGGGLVRQESISRLNGTTMDVSSLSPGIYLVKIQTAAGIEIEKLLIQ